MHEKNLNFLRCIQCRRKIALDVLQSSNEIDEGFLICYNCNMIFPIIEKIPIIVNDFTDYLANRFSLQGKIYALSRTPKMKEFLKKSLPKSKISAIDHSLVEEHWSKIYKLSSHSSFYSLLKSKLNDLPSCENVVEFGSSVGIVSNSLRRNHKNIFGIDISFFATLYAKSKSFSNLDYFVADVLNHPFGKKKFDLVLALNMLEVVEPLKILEKISQMTSNYVVLSDPYDYVRGKNTVNFPLYENDIRKKIRSFGFSLIKKTNIPNSINWTLKINPRTKLNYKVDVIIAKKLKKLD